MLVGVPKETAEGERRVALVPDVVRRLAGHGVEVLVVHVSARTVRPARGRLGRRRAGLIARIVGAEIAAARYRLPIPFAMITCPERTSGIRHEPFCCAVAVRPQQDTSPDRDSRLRTADDGQGPQARSQERRLSSIGPPSLSGESVLATIRDTRRNRRASHAEKERNAVWEIDIASGGHRVFANGLRNPVGLAWHPETGALWVAVNERDEAEFVTHRIRDWVAHGGQRREVAILYRSNAQSRVFEEAFLSGRIPYKVYGGLRFFERAEIKDALAYLRLIGSRADDNSFERVVNLPVRGIGAKTMDTVRDFARSNATSLWNGALRCVQSGLPQRAALALQAFLALIDKLAQEVQGLELHEQVDHVIQMSGLIEHFKKEKGERGEGRIENLLELVSAARGFSPETETEAELSPLESFLAHAVLESGEGQADPYDDCVQMMTLHSAKGLEFPVVFLAGMEDGLFPHQRSVADLAGLEEERRLCYVGATRAMRQLYITYAEQRRLYGVDTYGQPSRFISELPPELVEEIRPRLQVSRPVFVRRSSSLDEPPAANMRMGSRVRHSKFGDGVVLNFEGNGPHARVQVNFERQGTKWLMLSYANLVRVE